MNIKNVTFLVMFMTFSLVSSYLNAQCNGGTVTPTNNWALNRPVTVTMSSQSYSNFYPTAPGIVDGDMNNGESFSTTSYDYETFRVDINLGQNRLVDFIRLKYNSGVQVYLSLLDENGYEVFATQLNSGSFEGDIQVNNVGYSVVLFFTDLYSDGFSLEEVQACQVLSNLSIGATATNTYHTSMDPPAYAIDGVDNTYCTTNNPWATTSPLVFEVDFKNESTIDHIEMNWSSVLTSCKIEAFYDETAFVIDGYSGWIELTDVSIGGIAVNLPSAIITYTHPWLKQTDYWKKIRITYDKPTLLGDARKLYEIKIIGKQKHFNYGGYMDERNGEMYPTVNVNGKLWFQKNLNYDIPGHSWYYDDNEVANKKYGKLYDQTVSQCACPNNWIIPFDEFFNMPESTLLPNGTLKGIWAGYYDPFQLQYKAFGTASLFWSNYHSAWQPLPGIYNGVNATYGTKSTPAPHGLVADFSIVSQYMPNYTRAYIRCIFDAKKSKPNEELRRLSPDLLKKLETTNIVENEDYVVSVYPNPNTGSFKITLNQQFNLQTSIQILAMDGRIVYQKVVDRELEIPVNLLVAKGLYTLKVVNSKETISKLISIQ